MNDKKNIDRIYQERFKDFEPDLPADMWNRIESNLVPKKRRLLVSWWYYGGIAAGLAILFTVFYNNNSIEPFGNQNTDITITSPSDQANEADVSNERVTSPKDRTQIGDIDTFTESQDKNEYLVSQRGNNESKELENSSKRSVNGMTEQKDELTNSVKIAVVGNSGSRLRNADVEVDDNSKSQTPVTAATNNVVNTIADNGANNKVSNDIDRFEKNTAIEGAALDPNSENALAILDSLEVNDLVKEALALQENQEDSVSVPQVMKKKFTGSTLIAPVYSNTLSGSSINSAVAENSTEAGYNFSYGVAVGYAINDRWTVRTGIHKTDVTYTTNNVRYTSGVPSINSPFSTDFNANNISKASDPIIATDAIASQELISNSFLGLTGELSQQLGYVEVPVEMRYKLIDSRFNLSVTGGFSAMFLQENNVQILNDDRRLELGSDNNFRDFNQSANFGLGFDYGLSEKLGLMIEPMFKYQFNAISNDPSGFRPYTIAIYSGLTYKF